MKKSVRLLTFALTTLLTTLLARAAATTDYAASLRPITDGLQYILVDVSNLADSGDPLFVTYMKVMLFALLFAVVYYGTKKLKLFGSSEEELKKSSGARTALAIIISLIAVLGIPASFLTGLYSSFSGITMLLLVLLPSVTAIYFTRQYATPEDPTKDTAWQKLLRGGIYVIIGYFALTMFNAIGAYQEGTLNDVIAYGTLGGMAVLIMGIIRIITAFGRGPAERVNAIEREFYHGSTPPGTPPEPPETTAAAHEAAKADESVREDEAAVAAAAPAAAKASITALQTATSVKTRLTALQPIITQYYATTDDAAKAPLQQSINSARQTLLSELTTLRENAVAERAQLVALEVPLKSLRRDVPKLVTSVQSLISRKMTDAQSALTRVSSMPSTPDNEAKKNLVSMHINWLRDRQTAYTPLATTATTAVGTDTDNPEKRLAPLLPTLQTAADQLTTIMSSLGTPDSNITFTITDLKNWDNTLQTTLIIPLTNLPPTLQHITQSVATLRQAHQIMEAMNKEINEHSNMLANAIKLPTKKKKKR